MRSAVSIAQTIDAVTLLRDRAHRECGCVVGGFFLDQRLVEVEENRFDFHARSDVQDLGQHFSRMIARIDAVIDARDLAMLIDEETHALGVLRFRIGAGAVGKRDLPIRHR